MIIVRIRNTTEGLQGCHRIVTFQSINQALEELEE